MYPEKKSLKVNALLNAILTLSTFIFPLITFPYVSRILQPEGTGKVSFATSIVAYFILFSQLGIPTYGIRTCAKVRDDKTSLSKTVHEILFINIAISIVIYIFFFIIISNISRLNNEKSLYVILSFPILLNALGAEWLYKALEQYKYITIRSIVFKAIAVVATFLLIHTQNDYKLYAGITVFASTASNILNFINLRKWIYIRNLDGYKILEHMKPIMVFFAMACATTVYINLDNIMLGVLKSNVDVGYYNAAVKIRNMIVSLVTSLGVVLLPRATYYYEQGQIDKFLSINRKALNIILMISVPFTVFFVSFAKEGVLFLSGESYWGAILPMQILMFTLLFIGMTNILGIQMLVPIGKEIVVLKSEVIGAIVDLVINILLIPRYGSCGAAIGTLIAEIIVWIIQIRSIDKIYLSVYNNNGLIKATVASVLAMIISIWIKRLSISIIYKLVLEGFMFFGTYFSLMIYVFKERDIIELKDNIYDRIKSIV